MSWDVELDPDEEEGTPHHVFWAAQLQVINWAKAWTRAKTPEKRAHAKKMLNAAVAHLEQMEKNSR